MNYLKQDSTTYFLRIFTLSLLLFSLFLNTARAVGLPDLGSQDQIAYDNKTEQKLGRAFTNALHTQYTLNYDPEVVHYIRQLGHKIASYTGDAREFTFYIIENPSINAFAGPNGVIGIHAGLIQAAETEDELASVIAHEIAHITQFHLSRRHEQMASKSSLTSFATILAAILIGVYEPTAMMPAIMAGMGLNIESQLKNSRQHEEEADSVGISLLHKAGYDPHAMGSFFSKLDQVSINNTFKMPEILRSHPVTQHRIASAENRADLMPYKSSAEANHSLALIKLRLASKSASTSTTFNKPVFLNEFSQCYFQNATVLRNSQYKRNYSCLQSAILKYPDEPLYTSLLIELVIQDKSPSNELKQFALRQADIQYALFPSSNAIVLRYSELLLKYDSVEKAIALLIKQLDNNRYQYFISKKLSEIYSAQNKLAQAYFFKANSEFSIDNIERTLHLLEQASKYTTPAENDLIRKIETLSNISNNLLNLEKKL